MRTSDRGYGVRGGAQCALTAGRHRSLILPNERKKGVGGKALCRAKLSQECASGSLFLPFLCTPREIRFPPQTTERPENVGRPRKICAACLAFPGAKLPRQKGLRHPMERG
jgi:hypothetical protein